eukprot:CAMPEP_0118950492 /NCGR_PEP_ID=MMETSP1169-20130426/51472_1 /TAXON_ID=36882 /ORGANISM="Pyramimonas obovata, Strain CCMP722" /LENGTH=116 /DNA_ID=CAMNT_0006897343 /DNA_START=138 /DNA_END=485 /DNA_ORIENTATION=+
MGCTVSVIQNQGLAPIDDLASLPDDPSSTAKPLSGAPGSPPRKGGKRGEPKVGQPYAVPEKLVQVTYDDTFWKKVKKTEAIKKDNHEEEEPAAEVSGAMAKIMGLLTPTRQSMVSN